MANLVFHLFWDRRVPIWKLQEQENPLTLILLTLLTHTNGVDKVSLEDSLEDFVDVS